MLETKAAYLPSSEGLTMVTYGNLFLFCTLIVALIGLCYTVFNGKK